VNHRVNIATALVLAACAVPTAQAADLRAPGGGSHSVPVVRSNVLANLGHEGSGLVGHKNRVKHKAVLVSNVFANLGHEGSGLEAAYAAAAIRPWAN
jgi:hypothetical protein